MWSMLFITYAQGHVRQGLRWCDSCEFLFRRSFVTTKAQRVCVYTPVFEIDSALCTKEETKSANNTRQKHTILSSGSDSVRGVEIKKIYTHGSHFLLRITLHANFTCKHFSCSSANTHIHTHYRLYQNELALEPSANSCELVTACKRALNFTQFLRVQLCFCVHVRFLSALFRTTFGSSTHDDKQHASMRAKRVAPKKKKNRDDARNVKLGTNPMCVFFHVYTKFVRNTPPPLSPPSWTRIVICFYFGIIQSEIRVFVVIFVSFTSTLSSTHFRQR